MSEHLTIFNHHIYEYSKGLRRLVLYTGHSDNRQLIETRLNKNDISFYISEVTSEKINCFFGDSACISVVELLGKKALNELSDEEDFIIGAMLGYDIKQQCNRYLQRVSTKKELQKVA